MDKRLTEEEFRRAISRIKKIGDKQADAAYGVLVLGRQQKEYAGKYGCTKSNISQTVKRVYEAHSANSGRGEQIPPGYKLVVAILPIAQAYQVEQWDAAARKRRDKP